MSEYESSIIDGILQSAQEEGFSVEELGMLKAELEITMVAARSVR